MSACILAIESSCDETAVALVDQHGNILAHELASQIELHRKYGGVVPEVASRSHFDVIRDLGAKVLNVATEKNLAIQKVAATVAPGLVGPLLVGSSYAQGLATGLGIKFVGVHHLRGHLASTLLLDKSDAAVEFLGETLQERASRLFPAIVLLVSGGHSQVLEVDSQLRARKIIDTCDDAAGECFDKSAKLMGLPYPGGPEIEKLALQISSNDLSQAREISKDLPRPKDKDGNFSFSGLKTAIRLKLEKDPSLKASPIFCWAIEDSIAASLMQGLQRSWDQLKQRPASLVVCGGVAANAKIRHSLQSFADAKGLSLHVPPIRYCTDNAAMIGAAAWVQHPDTQLFEVKARVAL